MREHSHSLGHGDLQRWGRVLLLASPNADSCPESKPVCGAAFLVITKTMPARNNPRKERVLPHSGRVQFIVTEREPHQGGTGSREKRVTDIQPASSFPFHLDPEVLPTFRAGPCPSVNPLWEPAPCASPISQEILNPAKLTSEEHPSRPTAEGCWPPHGIFCTWPACC